MSKGGGGQQQGGGGGDNATDFLWIIVLLIVAVGAGWYFGRPYLVPVIFKVKLAEVAAVHWLLRGWGHVAPYLGLAPPSVAHLDSWVTYAIQAEPKSVEFATVRDFSHTIGVYIRYPIAFLLGAVSLILGLTHVSERFRTVFDMSRLRKAELVNWYQIAPVESLNLVDIPLHEGPWAMSLTPIQFVRKHDLVTEITKDGRPALALDQNKTRMVLALQLGEVWDGLEKMTPPMQALFAVFAARAAQDSKGANALLEQIARSASAGKGALNFQGTRALLVKHVQQREIGRIIGRHAYVSTIMISMLELARTDGVVAPVDFLWLKVVDRRMWYTLNNVGRSTCFPEVAGIYAHWKVEERLSRPLKVPHIEEGVNAVQEGLDEIKYNPDTM